MTAAQAYLTSATHAGSEIDRVLVAALKLARPSYCTLPTDLVHVEIDASPLDNDLRKRVAEEEAAEQDDEESLQAVVEEIGRLYEKAKSPIILVRSFGPVGCRADGLIRSTRAASASKWKRRRSR